MLLMIAHLFIPEDLNPGARPGTAFPEAIATVPCPG
jgi:hypothetical protein